MHVLVMLLVSVPCAGWADDDDDGGDAFVDDSLVVWTGSVI